MSFCYENSNEDMCYKNYAIERLSFPDLVN